MNQATSDFESELDAARWRSVLRGITMLLAAWVGAPLLGMLLASCVVTIVGAAPIALAGLVIPMFGALGYLGVGIGHCYRIPADSGARAPLVGIALLLLTAVVLILVYMRFFFPGFGRRWLTLAIEYGILGSLALAQLAWLLFLRAIAIALDGATLSRIVRNYAVAFSVWAGIIVAVAWTTLAIGENPVGNAVMVASAYLLLGHYFGMLVISESARILIEERLRIHDQLRRSEAGSPSHSGSS